MSSDAEHSAAGELENRAGSLRIDQPHVMLRGEPHAPAERPPLQLVGAPQGSTPSEVGAGVERSLEQLREHAAQLAERLQAEQGTLERRATALASQEADLEAKWQGARQWLEERQQELDERSESITRREQELSARETSAEARVRELTQVREETLTEREARLANRTDELERR